MNIIQQYRTPEGRQFINNVAEQTLGTPLRALGVAGMTLAGHKLKEIVGDTVTDRRLARARHRGEQVLKHRFDAGDPSVFMVEDVPAPPLVGVEVNPGPSQAMVPYNSRQFAMVPKKRKNKKKKNNESGFRLGAAPANISTTITTRKAYQKRGAKSTIVSQRELVSGSIAGSTSFVVQASYPLNPGMNTTFPWLATVASEYEEYSFKALKFIWIPIAPTSTQGDILLSPDYNATNVAPNTEQQAVDHIDSCQSAVWNEFECVLDPKSLNALGPRRYVRNTLVAGDLKTFDSGTLYVCSNNQTGTSAIGKLWVEYTVELFTPCLSPIDTSGSIVSVFSNSAAQTITTATNTQLVYNTIVSNPLGVGLAANSHDFTLAPGYYKISFQCTVKDTASETFSGVLTINLNGMGVSSDPVGIFTVAGVANNLQTMVGSAYLAVTAASNPVDIVINLTGASGTLTVVANSSFVEFQIV